MIKSAEKRRTWSMSRAGAAGPTATAWWTNHSAAWIIRRSSGTFWTAGPSPGKAWAVFRPPN